MKITEIISEQVVTKNVEIVKGYQCDQCRNIINSSEKLPKEWVSFSLSHNAWGNDSIESYTNYDVCSLGCFLKILQRKSILNDYGNYPTSKIHIDYDGIDFQFLLNIINYIKCDKTSKK